MNKAKKMKKWIYLFVGGSMMLSNVVNAQVVNTESFESTTFVPTGWTDLNVSGTNIWSRVTIGTAPAQTAHSGSAEAKFNSYTTDAGVRALITPVYDLSGIGSNTATVSFWMYRDNGYSTAPDKIDAYINTTASLTGATLIGTVNRSRSLAPLETADGWFQYTFNVPETYTGSSNYLIIQATSAYGNNIFIDDVSWDSYPPICSGTPNPGNTSAYSESVCLGSSMELTLQNTTNGSGVEYQWKSSSDNVNYLDIIGATASTYITTPTEALYYKCTVTCTSSGGSATSQPIQITINPFYNCYCSLAATSVADTDIGNVTFGSLNNGSATPVTDNSLANGTYTDYTSITPTELGKGESIEISLSQITSGADFYSAWFNVFIDYDQNGEFDLTTERAFTSLSATTQLSPTQTGIITIPSTALSGLTRMRVRLSENGSATDLACGTFGYGEVEDYFVSIICPSFVTPTIDIQNGTTLVASGGGTSYQWLNCTTGNTPIAGATSATYEATENGSYAVISSDGNCSDTSDCVVVNSVGLDMISHSLNSVKISPNPTTDKIALTFTGTSSATVLVYDLQGKNIMTFKDIQSGDIVSLESLQAGMYTLKIINELGVNSQRVIKK